MGHFRTIRGLLLLCVLGISALQAVAALPDGYWKTEESKAKVHVYSCGGSHVCGKIVALKEPLDPETKKEKTDPQGRPMIGMEIMKNFSQAGENKWEGGTVYDPKEGKEYSGEFTLSPDGNTMELRGYMIVTLLGRTQTWHRTTEKAPLK
jgi:uncharacterized protein (DUF2147 family)